MKKITGLKISYYTVKVAGISIFLTMLSAAFARVLATGQQFEFNFVWFIFFAVALCFLVVSSALNPVYTGNPIPDFFIAEPQNSRREVKHQLAFDFAAHYEETQKPESAVEYTHGEAENKVDSGRANRKEPKS